MGYWVVPADLLAHARFAVSPLAEVAAAMGSLSRPRQPEERAFAAANGEAFAAMLDANPLRALVLERSRRVPAAGRPGWIADHLALPPEDGAETFDRQLGRIAALPAARLRVDLETTAQRALPPGVGDAELVAAVVGLLTWVWTHTVASDWPRRSRLLRADVVARSSRLATAGWASVVRDLGEDREWTSDGRLRINRYDLPDRALPPTASLVFVPLSGTGGWVGEDGDRFAVHYPVSGRLVAVQEGSSTGLDRLIGATRASLLRMLAEPAGTTSIAARAGLPIGTVGDHLRILLEAGAVMRRRSGRDVLYWRTPLGEALVAAG
jgi:DNA-binding transcriptional ArsR family regulator